VATRVISFGTPIILADSTDYNPTAGTGLTGTRTHQLDLGGIASGAYRQSAKFDFFAGGSSCPEWWFCRAAIVPASAPTAGLSAEIFLAFSDDGTAANNNPGNLSGSDGAYTGYGGAAGDADEQIGGQFLRLGAVVFSADSDTHIGDIGRFPVLARYGIVVVRNSLNVALATSAAQMSVQLWPITETIS